MKAKKQYQILLPLLISVMLAIGMLVGYGLKVVPVSTDNQIVKYNKDEASIGDVIGLIDKHYYTEKNSKKLVDNVIYKIIEELDPFSTYIPAHQTEILKLSNEGKYLGLGIETIEAKDGIYITKIFQNSPANQVGLLKGSQIFGVNGNDLEKEGWNSDSISLYLRHNKNELLKLDLDHINYDSTQSITLNQGEVTMPNISDVFRLEESIGYIRISKFGDGVYRDFMESVEILLTNDKLGNLIIDLRSNPGGFLQEACKIISQFIPKNVEFLKTVDSKGHVKPYSSIGQTFFEIGNIIIIIDRHSASASEILAGVLQDLDRAIIIGEPSFGKGLVQEQFNLSNGGVLRLSVSRYQLPSGRYIGYSEKDSIGQMYTSLNIKRNIKANGKVNPDIEIKIKENKNSKDVFLMAIERINAMDRKYKSYQEFMKSYEMKSNGMNSDYDVIVKHEMASILFGDKAVQREKIINDDFVIQALATLQSKDKWGIIKPN